MPSIYREAGCWSRTSVRLSDDLSVFFPSSADEHPQDEETDDEDSEASRSNLVPINDPSVLLWFALELARLNNPLHHLMSEEVLIVKILSLLWLAKVYEEILFLVAHFVNSTSTTFMPPTFAATVQASSKEVKVLAHLGERVNW